MTIRALFCAVLAITIGLPVAADDAPEIPHDRAIDVYWAETPPLLDGKLDDDCWRQAAVATDFRQFGRAHLPADRQTEVRMAYDANYLYFYYQMADSNIDELRVGRPDDARDEINVSDNDVIELFLDPGLRRGGEGGRSAYYQFCTTPLGARHDLRITPGMERQLANYDPDWDVAAHIGEDYWAVEFRIPFASLVFDHEFIATPQPGDEWGVNFCRDQAYLNEWSYWSPTRSRSFHRPAEIGRARFLGRRDAAPTAPIRWATKQSMHYGAGVLAIELPERPGLTVEWTLRHDRQAAPDAGRVDPEDPARFHFHLTRAGFWEAQVRVKENGQDLFFGATVAPLEPVMEILGDILERVRAGKERAANLAHPAAPELRQAIATLDQLISPLATWLDKPAALSPEQWRTLLLQVPEIEAQWTPVRYGIALLDRADPELANQQLAVSTAGPAERVYRDAILPPSPAPVELRIAGRERESFQIVVMPMWRDVPEVQVQFTELRGDAGVLPATCFEYSIVDYIKLHDSWGGRWTPDILNPGQAFALKQNHTQPVWIDVRIPADTPRGAYHGAVILETPGQSVRVPVTVHARGFDIPERRSIQTDPWYWPLQTWNRRYYKRPSHFNEWARSGFTIPFEPLFTPEIYEQHLQVLSRYRYAAYPFDYTAVWEHIRIYREANGHITFDFSGLDWIIELGQKYGADSFPASFGCAAPQLYPLVSTRLPIFDRETGEVVATPMKFLAGQFDYVRGKTTKDQFINNPLFLIFMRQLSDYLRDQGILHLADYEIYDEPSTGPAWREIERLHGFLKRYIPDLRLKSYGVGPWSGKGAVSPIGLYDVWAPILGSLTPERVAQLRERQALGESFWFYTCGSGYRDSDGSTRPHICHYQHPLAPRMHGWIAWKLGADGLLIFALNSTPGTNVQPDEAKYFTEPIWHADRSSAQGSLVYPGPDYTMIPSIRLAAVRDGLEDYEYFHVLKTLAADLDAQADAELLARVHAALEVPEDIVSWDWHVWAKDPELLNARRDQLAALILAVRERRP